MQFFALILDKKPQILTFYHILKTNLPNLKFIKNYYLIHSILIQTLTHYNQPMVKNYVSGEVKLFLIKVALKCNDL